MATIATTTTRRAKQTGTAAADTLTGTAANGLLRGADGSDLLLGGLGDDLLEGGLGADTLHGEDGSDLQRGGEGTDSLLGGTGGDRLWGDGGNDALLGGDGADLVLGGLGYDLLEGGAGDDTLQGNEGADTLRGGDGADPIRAGAGDDLVEGGAGDDAIRGEDVLMGGDGNDMLCSAWDDDSCYGGFGEDILWGGDGNDLLIGGLGSDFMAGCYGADFVLSRSDAGEPEIAAAPGATRVTAGGPAMVGNDTMDGSHNPDVYRFELLLNARTEVIGRHLNADGSIDWAGVTTENGAAHDHWVEGIGHDVILSYRRAEGDSIEVFGHEVEVAGIAYTDLNGDGRMESVVSLRAAAMGGAHDGDLLGSITVFGDRVTMADVTLRSDVAIGAFASPELGPFPDESFGTQPVGWTGPLDWVA